MSAKEIFSARYLLTQPFLFINRFDNVPHLAKTGSHLSETLVPSNTEPANIKTSTINNLNPTLLRASDRMNCNSYKGSDKES